MTWSFICSQVCSIGPQYGAAAVCYAGHRNATGAPHQHHHRGREDEAAVRARCGGYRQRGAVGITGTGAGAGREDRPCCGGC